MKTFGFALSYLFVVMVQAIPSAMTSGPYGFAVGGGDNSTGEHFSFSAHDGPDGPTGYARVEFPTFTIQGPVTCYANDGPNAARFGIQITKASGDVPAGSDGFVFAVIDNGDPGSAGPDLIGTGFTDTPPVVCPAQVAGTAVVTGNIVVDNP
ncbi:MAG: hypothetical protein R6X02_14250 [Enhygromyxa sp.]